MRLSVLNCPDKDFKPFIKRGAFFYAECLLPSKRLRENINLTIKFNDKLTVWGFASIEDYNASNKPRDFLIELHPWISAKNILKTLAHEMVHIKQFVNLETNETLSKWKGTPIDPDKLDYFYHPWEMEAHSLEPALFTKFVIDENLWEVFDGISNPNDPIEIKDIGWKDSYKKIVKNQ